MIPRYRSGHLFSILLLAILAVSVTAVSQAAISFQDNSGRQVALPETPARVVSLVPEISEAIWALGQGKTLKGTTIHSIPPVGNPPPALVGGYFAPSLEAIKKLKPQLVFVGGPHHKIREKLDALGIPTVYLQARNLSDLYRCLDILGQIFGRQERAKEISQTVKERLGLIAKKVALLPKDQRRRVMRIMSVNPQGGFLTTPGDDSFQNDLIRAAGGLPPNLGKEGKVTKLDLAQWKKINPQAVYVCGPKDKVLKFLSRPGWREAEAVKQHRVFSFPCPLTCQVSVNSGIFVEWLSAWVYGDYFGKKPYMVKPWAVVKSKPIKLDLKYVKKAEVLTETIQDFSHRTLLIQFAKPQTILSTLEGQRSGISAVGNHYFPPPSWRLGQHGGLSALRAKILGVLGREAADTSLLFTGADLNNLAVERAAEKGLEVYALVTAGARHNAWRASVDLGLYVEPGTINMLILSNRALTPRAMARALVTATEAKSAALQDLDVRSSYTPLASQATGTGTDNILVVQGEGAPARLSGGHSKLGELIARAVYAGVNQALLKQNRLRPKRSIFQRLKERRVSLYGLAGPKAACPLSSSVSVGRLEELLLEPRYAALVEAALALSDAQQRGQLLDLSFFQSWCEQTAREIAAKRPLVPPVSLGNDKLPRPLALAFEALLRGLASQPVSLIPVSGPDCGS